ncbi:MAG TPA: dienelactone hydrolase family protein [Candidatus Binatia bacterium]|nr:dienelactone hydrolase family protein [Candidatus Binatia bacterium]
MAEEIKRLLEELRDGRLSRREFMSRAIMITGSLAAANAIIGALAPSEVAAAQVDENDPTILTHNVSYDGKAGKVTAYLVRPVKAGKYPGVIVIHENVGLSDHIRDVARRLAKEGYVVLAPDYLSRLGGTRLVTPKGTGISNISELVPWPVIVEDTVAGFNYLRILPDVRADKQGLIGFCWGGEMTFAAATQIPTLDAAVVFYGRSPNPLDLVKTIRAPVMAHYGEKDAGVNKGINDTVAAMKKYNKVYDHRIYSDAQHAFNNDTRKDRYHAEAAKEAWGRTLAFLKKRLQA